MNNINSVPLVSLSCVSKTYGSGDGKINALSNVNLEINKGEFVSVMGPSGCGKSTLLYLIGGLDFPTLGTVKINGQDLSTMKDKQLSSLRCCELGFVFQFYNLVENLTVEENILLPLITAGVKTTTKECKDKLSKIILSLGLNGKEKAFPFELSGGQQQRVSIARAIIGSPKLILADEPTGNLDTENGKAILDLFENIHKTFGVAILLVTHSETAANRANRLITMCDGQIVSDLTVKK